MSSDDLAGRLDRLGRHDLADAIREASKPLPDLKREARIDRVVWAAFWDCSAFGLKKEIFRSMRAALAHGVGQHTHRAIIGRWFVPGQNPKPPSLAP